MYRFLQWLLVLVVLAGALHRTGLVDLKNLPISAWVHQAKESWGWANGTAPSARDRYDQLMLDKKKLDQDLARDLERIKSQSQRLANLEKQKTQLLEERRSEESLLTQITQVLFSKSAKAVTPRTTPASTTSRRVAIGMVPSCEGQRYETAEMEIETGALCLHGSKQRLDAHQIIWTNPEAFKRWRAAASRTP